MTRLAPTARPVGKWMALSLFALLGCAPSLYPPPPSSGWNTPLPTGVTRDAGVFRTQMAAVPVATTYERARPGTCRLCVVIVRIEALGTTVIDPNNAPAGGAPVARMQNLDPTDTEAFYGLEPNTRYVYYLWVDRKPSSTKARWTVVRVPVGAGEDSAGYQKDLKVCHARPGGYTRGPDADFVEYRPGGPCTAMAMTATPPTNMHVASLIPTESFLRVAARIFAFVRGSALIAGGGWINCSMGCCT